MAWIFLVLLILCVITLIALPPKRSAPRNCEEDADEIVRYILTHSGHSFLLLDPEGQAELHNLISNALKELRDG